MTDFATYFHRPAPPLDQFIDVMWLYEGYSQPYEKERLLPTGAMQLLINFGQETVRVYDVQQANRFEEFSSAVVSGAYAEPFVIDTACQASVMGVCFKPGGAFPFFDIPANQLRNTHVSLEDLWHGQAYDVRDQLFQAKTPAAKFRILEHALLAHMCPRVTRHPAVAYAIQAFECASGKQIVGDVTEQIGLSARRFSQIFSEEVGLTPKLFCRIRRFQNLLCHIQNNTEVDWADVALACGYYDQAHFIHDFQTFSGVNPTTYSALRTPHRNHVPLLD
jgi:AraC-like DNA-binding protein